MANEEEVTTLRIYKRIRLTRVNRFKVILILKKSVINKGRVLSNP